MGFVTFETAIPTEVWTWGSCPMQIQMFERPHKGRLRHHENIEVIQLSYTTDMMRMS